jgi:hypothetical protein
MVAVMKVNGLKIIWKEWEFIFGMMAVFILASTKMIRSTALEFTRGQMAATMRDIGTEVSSMVSAHILFLKKAK